MSIYPYRNEVLEAIARKVIAMYDPRLLYAPAPTPVEIIMERVYGLSIEYQYIRKNGRVLGETIFANVKIPIYDIVNGEYKLVPVEQGTVIIDVSLLNSGNDGRFRYTCAHELAHWIIHKELFTQKGEMAAMTKTARSSEADNAIERQADRLAGYLLMPSGTVKMAFYRSHHMTGDRVAYLAKLFGVSKQAMGYRLKEMRLL